MSKSLPKMPAFGSYEPAYVFALWLRESLKDRPPETRRILAQIADVTEETVAKWVSGGAPLSPGFSKSLMILAALDGWREFWERLVGPADTLPDQVRAAISAMKIAQPKLAEHPPSGQCDEAIDGLLELQRLSLEMIEALRLMQKVRARDGQKLRAVD